jgi:hypothetical protein
MRPANGSPKQERDMAWPPVLGLNGWVVDPLPDAGGGGAAEVEDILDADLPTPAAGNLNLMYFVTDVRGGVLKKSNGVSWVEVGPALNDVDGIPTVTMAAAIAAGGALGDLSYVTHASWNQPVLARHNGTRWKPFNARQLLYAVEAPLTGTGTTTYTITLPSITLVGTMLGLNGGFEFELAGQSNVAPVAATPSITFDGYELAGNNAGANRRIWMGRRLRNQNSASAQTIFANAGASGAFEFQNNDQRATTKNSANDLVIAGTVVWTHAVGITGTVNEYKVWWI